MKVRIKYYILEVVNVIKFNVIKIIVNVIKQVLAAVISVDVIIVLTRTWYLKKIKLNKFIKRKEEKSIKLL